MSKVTFLKESTKKKNYKKEKNEMKDIKTSMDVLEELRDRKDTKRVVCNFDRDTFQEIEEFCNKYDLTYGEAVNALLQDKLDNLHEENMSIANYIYVTRNYNMFDLHELNREVRPSTTKFNELVESMRTHDFIDAYPIHCVKNGSDRLKIKSGHHRLRAAMESDIPVKYVICNDTASLPETEVAGPGKWTNRDYLLAYVRQGYNNYVELYNFIKETDISIVNAASMFYGQSAGSHNYNKNFSFIKGNFEIKNYEHPTKVGGIVLFLKSIGIDWASTDGFVKALSKIVWVPAFSPDRFKDKAKTFSYLLSKQKNVDDYINMIEYVYNYKAKKKDKINIAFQAQELSDERKDLNSKK